MSLNNATVLLYGLRITLLIFTLRFLKRFLLDAFEDVKLIFLVYLALLLFIDEDPKPTLDTADDNNVLDGSLFLKHIALIFNLLSVNSLLRRKQGYWYYGLSLFKGLKALECFYPVVLNSMGWQLVV